MSEIVPPAIETYLSDLRPDRDDILVEMETLAAQRNFPAVGPDVGLLLFILARAISARNILAVPDATEHGSLVDKGAGPDNVYPGFLCRQARLNGPRILRMGEVLTDRFNHDDSGE